MIVLQFVQGEDLGAKAIQWFSHSPWSHVDAVLPNGRLFGARDDVVGGAPAGVYDRDPSYVAGRPTRLVTIDCSEDETQKFYAFLREQLGRGYDEMAIAGFIAGRDIADPEKYYCSELQTEAAQTAGVLPGLCIAPHKVTPADLLLALSARGYAPLAAGS